MRIADPRALTLCLLCVLGFSAPALSLPHTAPAAATGQYSQQAQGNALAQVRQQTSGARTPLEAAVIATQSVESVKPNDPQIQQAARVSAENDARIAAAVTVALARAPAIPEVGVDVNAGVVTLSGSVIDDTQRQRAASLAKGVHGVAEVDNQLQLSMDLGTRLRATVRELQHQAMRWLAGTPLLLVALLILIGAHWLGGFISRRLSWLRLNSRNPYLNGVVSRAVYLVTLIAGAVMALDLLGATKLVGAVLGSAGVVGLALGFAFKDIGENYIAGIMLSLRRPFAPGDHVLIDDNEGRVVSLSSRATILMTLDGNHLRLPNGLVFKSIILNYTHNPKRRFSIHTDIDASQSISRATQVGLAALSAVDGVLDDPAPRMLLRRYGSGGVELEFQAWIDQQQADWNKTQSAATHAIKRAFSQAGIELTRTTYYIVDANAPSPTAVAEHANGELVDTAPDNAIDPQLAQAQAEQASTNLIAGNPDRHE